MPDIPQDQIDAINSRMEDLDKRNNDLTTVLQAAMAQAPPPADPTPQYADDETPEGAGISAQQVQAVVNESVAKAVNPVVANASKTLRAQNLAQARTAISDFTKYEKEIETTINQYGAQADAVGAQAGAYQRIYQYVKSLHLDEVVKEELERRSASAPSDEDASDPDAAAGEGEEPSPEAEAQAPEATEAAPSSRPEPPVPMGGTTGAGAARAKKPKPIKLTDEQTRVANLMGIGSSAYAAGLAENTSNSRDPFGFKDPKTGEMRTRV